MNFKTAQIESALDCIHLVVPSRQSTERLLRCYNLAYLTDQQLLSRTCDPTTGIDGLTERLTLEQLHACMAMRDTFTLEHRFPDRSECEGFVIVRSATLALSSIEGFQDYFLSDVFCRETLDFASDVASNHFQTVMSGGNVCYLAEFVSSGAPGITLSLVVAAYRRVSSVVMHSPNFYILGKCLEEVRVGVHQNNLGNRPIRAFVESLGLSRIGRGMQSRRLLDIDSRDSNYHAEDNPDALLGFALYLGDSSEVQRISNSVGASSQ